MTLTNSLKSEVHRRAFSHTRRKHWLKSVLRGWRLLPRLAQSPMLQRHAALIQLSPPGLLASGAGAGVYADGAAAGTRAGVPGGRRTPGALRQRPQCCGSSFTVSQGAVGGTRPGLLEMPRRRWMEQQLQQAAGRLEQPQHGWGNSSAAGAARHRRTPALTGEAASAWGRPRPTAGRRRAGSSPRRPGRR